MAPHAGYVYSGGIAGKGYRRVEVPERVVLLHPNHYGIGLPVAVAPHEAWETPLGRVQVDRELAENVMALHPRAEGDGEAHAREHSGEVHVPFLQFLRPDVRILPIAVGAVRLDVCLSLGEAVARAISEAGGPRGFLIVASSDMNHYEPASLSREKDQQAIDRLLALDAKGLHDTVRENDISMCGVLPVTVALAAAVRLGATRAELCAYGHSGETTGDHDAVVGYASVVVT